MEKVVYRDKKVPPMIDGKTQTDSAKTAEKKIQTDFQAIGLDN